MTDQCFLDPVPGYWAVHQPLRRARFALAIDVPVGRLLVMVAKLVPVVVVVGVDGAAGFLATKKIMMATAVLAVLDDVLSSSVVGYDFVG